MIPTAKGQRPESIDISAYVYSASSLLIHTLCLEVLSEYRQGFVRSNFLTGLDQESTTMHSQIETRDKNEMNQRVLLKTSL